MAESVLDSAIYIILFSFFYNHYKGIKNKNNLDGDIFTKYDIKIVQKIG